MSSAPFQPPSSSVEVPEQLRRLWRKLNGFDGVQTVSVSATAPEIASKVNEIIVKLKSITKG